MVTGKKTSGKTVDDTKKEKTDSLRIGAIKGKLRKAELWENNLDETITCNLCARHCNIPNGARGFCATRENIGGTLYAMNYGKACNLAIDPIEKKPLYHFHPGIRTLSVATLGCNFRCKFCCNWQISQGGFEVLSEKDVLPEQIVRAAKGAGVKAVSYTYTEPTIFFEYAYDTARIAHKQGLLNTFVTNGYSTPEMIRMISPYLDAVTVDFKGSGNAKFYKEFCNVPDTGPIYDALLEYKKEKVFTEVTDLLVPVPGGSEMDDVRRLCCWIVENLGEHTPMHFLRFFPSHHMTDTDATPDKTLREAVEIAKGLGMTHVYAGNVSWGQNTVCENCGTVIIERELLHPKIQLRADGGCPKCKTKPKNLVL